MQSQKLRLGILLDSFDVPAWAATAIRRIADGNSAEFALVILNGAGSNTKNAHRNTWLYSIYNWADEKLFSKDPDPFAPTNISGILSGLPNIRVLSGHEGDEPRLQEPDILTIREYQLDVVIKIGFENLLCDNLQLARYGIWFYYHGDDTKMRGGPPGFWEVAERRPETGTALLALGGEMFRRRVLYRSYFFTYQPSPARHRCYYFWAAASFLPRQIEFLHRFGESKFWQQTEQYNIDPPGETMKYEIPAGFSAIRPVARIIVRLLSEAFKRLLLLDTWFLLLSFHRGISDGFNTFEALIPPKDRFWADPHPMQQGGKYYIFIEEFLHATGKGHISVIELEESGKWRTPVKVLEKGYHLSYPFVFQWADKFYMVPESGGNLTIDLYESVDFPYKWEFKQTLIRNVKAVDTTLIYISGKWWLFTGIAENEAAAPNVELFLFYSDDLFGSQWTPHALNPIVSDVKRARPAGALFMKDGKLFRPSQDCSKAYGYGFDLNEIELLSETQYYERKTVSVKPDWDRKVLATHTYANCGSLTVIDAFTYTRKIG